MRRFSPIVTVLVRPLSIALAMVMGLFVAGVGLAGSASASISFDIYKSYNPTLTGVPVSLYADATSTCGSISEYRWRFGDGSTRATSDPSISHTWDQEGQYNVTLTVTDSCGDSESDGYTQTVKPDKAPTAAFDTTVADRTIYADPSASTDDDGVNNGAATPVYYYFWEWGDGQFSDSYAGSSNGLASHRFDAAGTYTITLTAYDTAFNASQPVTRTVTVPPPTPRSFAEDTSGAVTYRGSWTAVNCSRAACSPNHTLHRSATKSAKARFTFTGTEATWIATKGPRAGTAGVYVDGEFQTRIDLYRPTIRDGVAVYTTDTLNDGTHTLRVKVTRNKPVNVDGFYALPGG